MKTWERNQRVLSIYVASEQESHRVEIPNKLRVTGDKSDESSTLFTCLTVAMTKWPHLDFWIKNMEFSDLKCLGCMLPLPVFSWIKKQEKRKNNAVNKQVTSDFNTGNQFHLWNRMGQPWRRTQRPGPAGEGALEGFSYTIKYSLYGVRNFFGVHVCFNYT